MSRPSLRKEKAKEFCLSWLVLAFHAASKDLVEKSLTHERHHIPRISAPEEGTLIRTWQVNTVCEYVL